MKQFFLFSGDVGKQNAEVDDCLVATLSGDENANNGVERSLN
jgi:hypothetical protein